MQKPHVFGIVAIWAIRALWSIGTAMVFLQNISDTRTLSAFYGNGFGFDFRAIGAIVVFVYGLLMFAALLTAGFRRVGLALGALITGLDFAWVGAAMFLTGQADFLNVTFMMVDALILCQIYIYLTREPERLAFR